MEKGVAMDNIQIKTISPLVLAYMGDAVYESYVREHLVYKNPHMKVNDLHKTTIKYVRAKSQANIANELIKDLTEEEMNIFKRGRNQKSNTVPKNADILDYRHATGFEAVLGYLHLINDNDRLNHIINKSIQIVENDIESI
jgi:ribonuclease-3 family protein